MGFLSSIGDIFSASNSSGLLSSVVDGTFGIIGQNSANAKNKRQWQRERSWEEEKMRNAHQWEAEDLKAAGLNPTLTAGGSGAVGSGSPHAEMGAGSFGNFGKDFINGYNTIETLKSQKELNETQGYKNIMEGDESAVRAGLMPEHLKNERRDSLTKAKQAETDALDQKAREKHMEKENELIGAQLTEQNLNNDILKIKKAIETSNYGVILSYIDRGLGTLKNGGNAVSSYIPIWGAFRAAAVTKDWKGLKSLLDDFMSSNSYKLMNKTRRPNIRRPKK